MKICGAIRASAIYALQLATRIMKFHWSKCLNGDIIKLYDQWLIKRGAAIEDKYNIINPLKMKS